MLAACNSRTNNIYRKKPLILRLAPLFAGALSLASVSAQNLVTNGDFEEPPYAPNSTITGWNVGGSGFIHSIEEGSTSPSHSAAFNVGGDSEGTVLSQSFATTVGALYRVDFDTGIFGMPDETSFLTLNVSIVGTDTLINDAVIPPAANTFDPSLMSFRHYQYIFRADSTTTTIQFADTGLGNSISDTVLDTVSVAPTPTPPLANLVNNGDFESPPFNTGGTVTGWSVGGNANIGETREGATTGTHTASFNAGSDSDGNTLSQTIPTVPGKQYTVDFDAGVFGADPGTPQQLNVTVTGNALLLYETVTPPLAGTFNPNLVVFDHYHFTFIADSALTVVTFSDIGTGNSNTDTMLDSVYIPQVNLLTNGDFETAPFNTYEVTGWTLSGGGKVELNLQGVTTPTHGAAFGTGGNPPGNQLSQSFPTTAGKMYSVDFDSGIYGTHSGSPMQLNVQITGNGTILDQTVAPPETGTWDPAQVVMQHYHFTFIANSGTATLQFQDLGSGGTSADVDLDTVAVVEQPVWSFEQWQKSNFTTAQRGNPSISGWEADPDTDLIANGLEYFSNTDPLAGTPTGQAGNLPRISVTTSGPSTYLTLTYHRLIGWSGNPEVIEVSDDLITWDSTQTQIEQVGTPTLAGDGLTEIVTVRLTTPINQGPIPRKFLRIALTQ